MGAGMLKYIALGVVGLLVAVAVYVRLAPFNEQEHRAILSAFGPGETTLMNGHSVTRELDDPQAALVALDQIIMATPRTVRFSGTVEGRVVTYVTRSRVFGFPDVTVVYAGPDDTVEGGHGDLLRIDGRARFGVSDMGVNKARIQGWLVQLDQDRPTP